VAARHARAFVRMRSRHARDRRRDIRFGDVARNAGDVGVAQYNCA